MDERKHEKFLRDIAKKTAGLLRSNPDSKKRFDIYLRNCIKKSKKYDNEWNKYYNQAKEKPKSKWAVYGNGTPPKEGFIWHNYGDGFWGPDLGFSHFEWINYHYTWNAYGGAFDIPEEPGDGTTEKLECECAVLATVHGRYIKNLSSYEKLFPFGEKRIYAFKAEDETLSADIEWEAGKDIRDNIEEAFKDVYQLLTGRQFKVEATSTVPAKTEVSIQIKKVVHENIQHIQRKNILLVESIEPDEKSGKSDESKKLPPSRQLALDSFRYALSQNEDSVKKFTLNEIYEWIMKPENLEDEKNPYKGVKEKPKLKTWKSYLRDACKHYNTTSGKIRELADKAWVYAKEKGQSVVYVGDIDYKSSQARC